MELERHRRASEAAERSAELTESARTIGAWVSQFARTLKNCRLYDAHNQAAQRFRSDYAKYEKLVKAAGIKPE